MISKRLEMQALLAGLSGGLDFKVTPNSGSLLFVGALALPSSFRGVPPSSASNVSAKPVPIVSLTNLSCQEVSRGTQSEAVPCKSQYDADCTRAFKVDDLSSSVAGNSGLAW
jgi:hypothetical protein